MAKQSLYQRRRPQNPRVWQPFSYGSDTPGGPADFGGSGDMGPGYGGGGAGGDRDTPFPPTYGPLPPAPPQGTMAPLPDLDEEGWRGTGLMQYGLPGFLAMLAMNASQGESGRGPHGEPLTGNDRDLGAGGDRLDLLPPGMPGMPPGMPAPPGAPGDPMTLEEMVADLYGSTQPLRQDLLNRYSDVWQGGQWNPSSSPAWGAGLNAINQSYDRANRDIMSRLPEGGALLEGLAQADLARARGISDMTGQVYGQELDRAFNLATGPMLQAAMLGGSNVENSALQRLLQDRNSALQRLLQDRRLDFERDQLESQEWLDFWNSIGDVVTDDEFQDYFDFDFFDF